MNTIVFLIRNSEKLDMKYIDRYYDDENYQITREKRILSAEGERKANILSKHKEFDKVDVIYSSSYVRTIQTAKYLAERLDKKIHVNRNLNERKYCNPKYAEDITLKQYYYEIIKNVEGESRKEVTDRMYKTFMHIINENKGKTNAIFSHGASIIFLLMKWCELINIDNEKRKCLKFKDKVIINKQIEAPEDFKIIINEKQNINDIENMMFKY